MDSTDNSSDKYYEILGIEKGSTKAEIKKAYKKMALKWHPDKHKGEDARQQAQKKFVLLSEAYEILSDDHKRALYEKFGPKAFTAGAGTSGKFPFGMRDAERVFNVFMRQGGAFMGTPLDSAFESQFGDDDPSAFGLGFGDNDPWMGRKDPPVHHYIRLSLEDLYRGTVKTMKVTNAAGKASEVKVEIRPGTYAQMQFTKHGVIPSSDPQKPSTDLILTVDEKPHEHFTREGNNLMYNLNIDLADALCGKTWFIPTLDEEEDVVALEVKEIIKPGTIKRLTSRGMPDVRNPNVKGDIVVKFSVNFPDTLVDEQKEALREILQ
jgi:DnaJ-class molecular chaperone